MDGTVGVQCARTSLHGRLHDREGLGMGVRPTGAIGDHDAQMWDKESTEFIFTRSSGPETSVQQCRLNEEGNGAWRGLSPGQHGADLCSLFSRDADSEGRPYTPRLTEGS